MEKFYKVVFVYPDGHIEEIQDQFKSGKEALEYGNNLLVQVKNTEGVLQRGTYDNNEFNFNEKKEPHFMIVELNGKKHSLVYDSLGR